MYICGLKVTPSSKLSAAAPKKAESFRSRAGARKSLLLEHAQGMLKANLQYDPSSIYRNQLLHYTNSEVPVLENATHSGSTTLAHYQQEPFALEILKYKRNSKNFEGSCNQIHSNKAYCMVGPRTYIQDNRLLRASNRETRSCVKNPCQNECTFTTKAPSLRKNCNNLASSEGNVNDTALVDSSAKPLSTLNCENDPAESPRTNIPLPALTRSSSENDYNPNPVRLLRRRTISKVLEVRQEKKLERLFYCIGKGNNSVLLRKLFRARRGWSVVEADDAKVNFIWTMYGNKKAFKLQKRYTKESRLLMVNHFPGNGCLVSKKGLYHSLTDYHSKRGTKISNSVPLTFHLTSGVENDEYKNFIEISTKLDADAATLENDLCANTQPHGGEYESGTNGEVKKKDGPLRKKGRRTGAYWIVKPASMTNRGMGIKVKPNATEVMRMINKKLEQVASTITDNSTVSIDSKSTSGDQDKLLKFLEETKKVNHRKDWIVQKYIENPLLYKGRKFDIRCFVLITGGDYSGSVPTQKLRCYLYSNGYLRTSSTVWSLDEKKLKNPMMHLTNDGIQCKDEAAYGKHERGNKVSYDKFQEYLTSEDENNAGVMESKILPQVKSLVIETMEAVKHSLAGETTTNFELLGYDFMVDDDFHVYLIEVNSNPCLEDWACPLLGQMINAMLGSMMHIAVDLPLNRVQNPKNDTASRNTPKHKRGGGTQSRANTTTKAPSSNRRIYKKHDFDLVWEDQKYSQ